MQLGLTQLAVVCARMFPVWNEAEPAPEQLSMTVRAPAQNIDHVTVVFWQNEVTGKA